MMRSKSSSPAAFTLIEIIVVIMIVTLLLAISIPSFSRMKQQGYAVKCTGNLRQIGVAMNSYLAEHSLTFPTLASARESRDDTDTPVLETLLSDYLDSQAVFKCPSDHEQFFERTGSSYFWNTLVNGQKMGNMNMLGIVSQESGIPLVSDKENFHKNIGGEVNILYADGHIFKELQFNVELD